jgi:hypothetical protein
MSKLRPTLRNQTLKITDEFEDRVFNIRIDSDKWFLWLDQNDSFRAEISIGRSRVTLSVRKEINGRHKTGYWYAYSKVDGKTKKKYLGHSSDLSLNKLQQVADDFLHEI